MLCKSNGKYICFWARTNESKEKQHAFPLHTSHWSIQVYLRSTEMQSVSLSNHSAACLSLCLPLINKGVGLQHHKRSEPSWPSKPQALGSKIFKSSPAPGVQPSSKTHQNPHRPDAVFTLPSYSTVTSVRPKSRRVTSPISQRWASQLAPNGAMIL